MPLTTSRDRVREVFIFVFILPLYYLWKTGTGRENVVRRRFRGARGSASCFPLKPDSASDVVLFKVCGYLRPMFQRLDVQSLAVYHGIYPRRGGIDRATKS